MILNIENHNLSTICVASGLCNRSSKLSVVNGGVCADGWMVRVDVVKGKKQSRSALECEPWSQAAVKEALWSRKTMCFPAKWLPVSGRSPERVFAQNTDPDWNPKWWRRRFLRLSLTLQLLRVSVLSQDQMIHYIATAYSMDWYDLTVSIPVFCLWSLIGAFFFFDLIHLDYVNFN